MREEIHVDIGTVTVAGFTVTGLRLEKPVNTRAIHEVGPQLKHMTT